MKKFVLIALAVLMQPAAYAADGLFFGALSASAAKNEHCYYQFTVPQVAPAPGSSSRSQKVADALNAKWKAALATRIAEYQTATLDPEMCTDWQYSWSVSETFEITTDLDAKIASLKLLSYSYTGGAHGGSSITGFTFNTETGAVYSSLAEFIDTDKLPALMAKIEEYVKYNLDTFDPQFGFEDWKKSKTSMYDITNFYFTANGLTIYFQEYEIASYAEGRPQADLGWEALNEIGLKKDGPAALLKKPAIPGN